MKHSIFRALGLCLIVCLCIGLLPISAALAASDQTEASSVSDAAFSSIIMTVGANETQRNLTWYAQQRAEGEVRYGKSSDGTLPADYKTATAFYSKATKPDYYSYKATMSELEANTTYAYCLVVGDTVSSTRTFKVGAMGDDFSFAFIADAQTGGSSDAALWADTLKKLKTHFSDTSFIVSGGDQTSDPAAESNFDYFIGTELQNLAIATTVGPPHDNSLRYGEHYFLPNLSSTYGSTSTSSDYFYTYNNVLFMHLNVENTKYDEHVAFMESAIAQNPDCQWRVVAIHYSFFTGGDHSLDGAVQNFRKNLAGKFSELGVSVVLSGHDHMYARSNMIKDGSTLSDDVVTNNSVTDPEGTLYLCGTRPSGGSSYEVIQHDDDKFVAYRDTVDRKAVVIFEVTDSSLTLKSYFMDKDTPELFDTFTINKSTPSARLDSDADEIAIKTESGYIPLVRAYDYTNATVKVIDGYWSISTDGEQTFTTLGVASTDTQTVLRINSDGVWELSEDGGASFTSLGIHTKSYTVTYVYDQDARFGDTTDLSAFLPLRFTSEVPDGKRIQLTQGSLAEGYLINWHWEYYKTDGTAVTQFVFGEEYLAYPASETTPIRNNLSIATTSDPDSYTFTWAEAFTMMLRCPGESFTITLSENITLKSSDKISFISPLDLTLDLNGYTLTATSASPTITFGVGSSTSTFKVVTSKEGGTINASGVDFTRLSANTGAVLSIQYGSEDSKPLTVSAGHLVGGASNFKNKSTLNLKVYNGTYTVSKGVVDVYNASATASENIYNLNLKNAVFQFSAAGASLVRFHADGYEARDASSITAVGCTFTNTYNSGTVVGHLIGSDLWLGTASYESCTFRQMAIDTASDGAALLRCGTITVKSGCEFYNDVSSFADTSPIAFASSKVSLPSGYALVRGDAQQCLKVLQKSDAVEITWYSPIGYSEYWLKGSTPIYYGETSFTAESNTYSIKLDQTPTVATENKTYTFSSTEGYLFRYDSDNSVWQVSRDGGESYNDITDAAYGCLVTVDGVEKSYPSQTDFATILSALNKSSSNGKQITIVLNDDMTLSSTYKFSTAQNYKLTIDLCGHTLTIACGGKVQFDKTPTLHIYSSIEGGKLVYAASSDCIQIDSAGKITFGDERYKNNLTITAPGYLINTAALGSDTVLEINYLFSTFNCGSYGVLRLNAKGGKVATLKANITGCTINGSASAICYNSSSSLSASSNGGVYSTDSYINFTDTSFNAKGSSVLGVFGHNNFKDRYFGKVSFTACTFTGYEINGALLYADEALSYNDYFTTLTDYNADETIVVGDSCVFKNSGKTFNDSKTDFTQSNTNLTNGTTILVKGDLIYTFDYSKHTLAYRSENGTHYRVCTDCDLDLRFDEGSCSGGEATCTSGAICEVCHLPYGNTIAHDYTTIGYDKTHHWDACECGAKDAQSVRAHEYDNDDDLFCNICDAERDPVFKPIQTPYGPIPEEYATQPEKYPILLFDTTTEKIIWAGTQWGGETDKETGSIGGVLEVMAKNSSKGTLAIYLQADASVTASYYNQGTTYGTHIIDLNGHTLTTTTTIFYAQAKNSVELNLLTKNGTVICNSGATLISLGSNKHATTEKKMNLTFENITFLIGSSSCRVVADSFIGGKIDASVIFNGCTFITPQVINHSLFNLGNKEETYPIHVQVNGGEFLMNTTVGLPIFKNVNGYEKHTIAFGEYNGAYPTIVAPSSVDTSKECFASANGVLGLRQVNQTDAKTTYVMAPLSFVSAYLNLGSDLNLIYRVFVPSGYENIAVSFTIDGLTTFVDEYTLDQNGLYLFRLPHINPAQMGKTVTAILTATRNGETLTLTNDTLSVKSYLDQIRSENANDTALIELINKLLVYGAAAQQYIGEDADSFVAEIRDLLDIPESENVFTLYGEGSDEATLTKIGMRLDGAFALRIAVRVTNAEGMTLVATRGGVERSFVLSECVSESGDIVVIYDNITPDALGEAITFTVKKNGENISKSFTVTPAAYLYRLTKTSEDASLVTLAKAAYAYGIAAKKYTEK